MTKTEGSNSDFMIWCTTVHVTIRLMQLHVPLFGEPDLICNTVITFLSYGNIKDVKDM